MKRQVPRMILWVVIIICILEIGVYTKEVNQKTSGRFEQKENCEWNKAITPMSTVSTSGTAVNKQKEDVAVTAEAAKRDMWEYGIGIISILLLCSFILLILLIKHPAEKKKKENEE